MNIEQKDKLELYERKNKEDFYLIVKGFTGMNIKKIQDIPDEDIDKILSHCEKHIISNKQEYETLF